MYVQIYMCICVIGVNSKGILVEIATYLDLCPEVLCIKYTHIYTYTYIYIFIFTNTTLE